MAEAKRGQKRRQHLAVPCFITRSGFRRRGLSHGACTRRRGLLHANVEPCPEGYSMIPEREGRAWGELNVGHVSIFAAAGFAEVSRPTLRRAVMRIDF